MAIEIGEPFRGRRPSVFRAGGEAGLNLGRASAGSLSNESAASANASGDQSSAATGMSGASSCSGPKRVNRVGVPKRAAS